MHSFDRLTADLKAFVDARDWAQFHTPKNTAICLSVEASELLELYLWSLDGDAKPAPGAGPPVRSRIEEEVGDVLISLINFCDVTGIDPLDAARRKLAALEHKYPAELARGSAAKNPGATEP
jgi:NTP pyrophosphatase (non-canonical NTP hydrolase)